MGDDARSEVVAEALSWAKDDPANVVAGARFLVKHGMIPFYNPPRLLFRRMRKPFKSTIPHETIRVFAGPINGTRQYCGSLTLTLSEWTSLRPFLDLIGETEDTADDFTTTESGAVSGGDRSDSAPDLPSADRVKGTGRNPE